MKLFFHYCSFGFSNCYVLGEEESPGAHPQAVIIDPGEMNGPLLECLEGNNFIPRAVLITHDHSNHVRGLKTLMRIYQPEIFAMNRTIQGSRTTPVKDGDKITIGPFLINVISIPGHSADSVVYQIDNLLFTGDVLTAGMIGTTASAYGTTTQINKVRSRLFPLPGDYTVFPGHGPPSTLEAERRFNMGVTQYIEKQTRRPAFKVDL